MLFFAMVLLAIPSPTWAAGSRNIELKIQNASSVDGIQVGTPRFSAPKNQNGCGDAPQFNFPPDNSALSVIFDNGSYSIDVGPKPKKRSQHLICNISIPLIPPPGKRVRILGTFSADWRGFETLGVQASGWFRTSYWLSVPRMNRCSIKKKLFSALHRFPAPSDEDIVDGHSFDALWKTCGKPVNLIVKSDLYVRSKQSDSYVEIDSLDIAQSSTIEVQAEDCL